jgi:hypothetical protein
MAHASDCMANNRFVQNIFTVHSTFLPSLTLVAHILFEIVLTIPSSLRWKAPSYSTSFLHIRVF